MTRHGPSTKTIGTVKDKAGRQVTLTRHRWDKILQKRLGKLDGLELAVMAAVEHAEVTRRGNVSGREVHYERNLGPSRWMAVVVAYAGSTGTVITAYTTRDEPPMEGRL
jgi:hypothetical protein